MSSALSQAMASEERPLEREETDSANRRLWLSRLRLTNFRNYATCRLDLTPSPLVLTGTNGAGKTNLLEAVSLLSPGRGLKQAAYGDMARLGGDGSWAVSAQVMTPQGQVTIGTGPAPSGSGRLVKIDGEAAGNTTRLGALVPMVWLTPAADGLFTGPAGERRRFLDRLIAGLDPSYRQWVGRFERAMRQRNRLLETGSQDARQFAALEQEMAETGVTLAVARLQAVDRLAAAIAEKWPESAKAPFPWATLALEGDMERDLRTMAAVDAEDAYCQRLAAGRERDRAARRTLSGPHRSDLIVGHGPKAMPARLCSTGEQKALLVGLVLAYAALVRQENDGVSPLILLDEIAAHLDEYRREALFAEILRLDAQAWLTGTEAEIFHPLRGMAQFFCVNNAAITAAS